MSQIILEKVLSDILLIYLSYDDKTIDCLLEFPNLVFKERIKKLTILKF